MPDAARLLHIYATGSEENGSRPKSETLMTKTSFVTLGKQRYCVHRPWPAHGFDPNGISDVTVMKDGRVVALMRTEPPLIAFTPSGKVDARWSLPGLVSGHYLSGRPEGGVLVVDWDGHQVLAVDADGTCAWTIGNPERPMWMAPFSHPASAAEAADGRLYVADGYGNFCLHRFDKKRNLEFTVGESGDGPGQFTTPHCVALAPDGTVYIADRENNRIQIFSADGVWQGAFGNVYKPMAVALAPDGNLLITDQTPCLLLMSPGGELMGRCRTSGMYGHGLACAQDGTIYISEMLPASLVRLSPVN